MQKVYDLIKVDLFISNSLKPISCSNVNSLGGIAYQMLCKRFTISLKLSSHLSSSLLLAHHLTGENAGSHFLAFSRFFTALM